MTQKRLDINITQEAIERNFKLLNVVMDGYDKKIDALQGSMSDVDYSDEIGVLVAEKMVELKKYINKMLAEQNSNLNDYRCIYANITAREYVDFRIVNTDLEREYTLRWSHEGIRLMGHDGSEDETVTGILDFAGAKFNLQYKAEQPFVVGDGFSSSIQPYIQGKYLRDGAFEGLQLGQINMREYGIEAVEKCTFVRCDLSGMPLSVVFADCTFIDCDMRAFNAYQLQYRGLKLSKHVELYDEEKQFMSGQLVVASSPDGIYITLVNNPVGIPGESDDYVKYYTYTLEMRVDQPILACRFVRCNLEEASFNYIGNSFEGKEITEPTFENCNMKFSRTPVNYSSLLFRQCDLRHSISGGQTGNTWDNCDMRNVVFFNHLRNNTFIDTKLDGAFFCSTGMANDKSNYVRTSMRGLRTRGVTSNCTFTACDCRDMDLAYQTNGYFVTLNTIFSDCDLRGVNFPYNAEASAYYMPQNTFRKCKLGNTKLMDKTVRDVLTGPVWENVFIDNDYVSANTSIFDFALDRYGIAMSVADIGMTRANIEMENGTAMVAGSKSVVLTSNEDIRIVAMSGTEDEGKVLYNSSTNKWQANNGDGVTYDVGDMRKEMYDTNNDGRVNAADIAASVEWSGVLHTPTTLAEYGITDGYTKSAADSSLTTINANINRKLAKDYVQVTGARIIRDVAQYVNGTAGVTGAIKITLPAVANGFLDFVIDGFNNYSPSYSSRQPWQARICCSISSSGASFSPSEQSAMITPNAPFQSIRLGSDGTNLCILLGTTSTMWNYPTVRISELRTTSESLTTNFTISLLTTENGFTVITTPFTNTLLGSANSMLAETTVFNYRDLAAYTASASVQGTLRILLPTTWLNTMMSVKAEGYNHAANASNWAVKVSGYNSNSSGWEGCAATLSSDCPFAVVRFGYDSTVGKCCILLGTMNTVWFNPKIVVKEMLATGDSPQAYASGWNLAIITDESNITDIVTPVVKTIASMESGAVAVTNSSAGNVRSGYFYNADDTAGNKNYIQVRQQVASNSSYSAYVGVDKDTGNTFLSNDNLLVQHLSVASSGNVGINVTAPQATLHSSGSTIIGGAKIADASLIGNSQVNFYIDEPSNKVILTVKYANGEVKTGSVVLS